MLHQAGVTQKLARFVAQTGWADIPPPVRHEAKRALLNFFAVALAGCRAGPVELALRSLAEFSDLRQATVIGRSERMDTLSAAFLNAAGANVLDFCDTHIPTAIHPTAPVAPVLFAMAERRRVTGCELLLAFVLGVELQCRIGGAISPGHYAKGWHITSTCGVFGAATAAGKLIGLDQRALDLGTRQRLHPGLRLVRMPGLARQEHQRRQCRPQRPVVGVAGREGIRRAGRADRRRAGLHQCNGRAAEVAGAHRGAWARAGSSPTIRSSLTLAVS